MTEVVLLGAVLAGATAFGMWRRHTDGRMRTVVHAGIAEGQGDPGPGAGGPGAGGQGAAAPGPGESGTVEASAAGAFIDAGEPTRAVGDPTRSGRETSAVPAEPILSAEDVSEPLLVGGVELGPTDHSVIPSIHVLSTQDIGDRLGERATLVQFSSAFCQPCRVTRVLLADVARTVPGVRHVEIDAESHLGLVRRVDVTRTPTVLVLDSMGRIRARATGAPRPAEVLATLNEIV